MVDRRAVGAGLLLVLATAIISGVSTYVNGFAVKGLDTASFVTIRNVEVALLVLPLGVWGFARAPQRLTGRDWTQLVAIGIVGGGIPFLLFFQGTQMAVAAGGATTASFVYRTLFVMATVLGIVVLRERFHWRAVLGGALLLAGNFLLLAMTTPIWTDGSTYVFVATAMWAVEYTLSKHVLRRLPSGVVMSSRMGFGAMFLVGYSVATAGAGSLVGFSSAEWQWIAVSALLLTAFVGTWYTGLARVDLGVATSVLVLGYPVTWVLSVELHGAAAILQASLGALIVALGVAVVVGARQIRETAAWVAGILRRGERASG
jgi:drug/metabolite transporter (DMT)-like permease